MIDISVKDLVKSFDEDENLLDGISFDVQSGERVGLLGKNGAGKTTLFKILTGEMDYNSGEIAFAQGKKVGLISQIPVYPAEFTVNDVLRAAFSSLDKIKARMRQLEKTICDHGLRVRLAEEQDVKRLLAIYYQQDLTTEVFRDFDGEEYMAHG